MKDLFLVFSLSSVVLLAFNSCKNNKEVVSASPQKENSVKAVEQTGPQLLASIERTACYGRCPIYKVTFMDNGEVKYIGKAFVDKVGTYKTLISAEEVLLIKKNIIEFDYFGLDSLYPTPIADFPSAITEVNLNGKRKKVINRRSPPENLKAFERFLDGLLTEKELVKVSDETDYEPKTK